MKDILLIVIWSVWIFVFVILVNPPNKVLDAMLAEAYDKLIAALRRAKGE